MPVPAQVVQQVMAAKFLGNNMDGYDLGEFRGADGGLKNVIDYTLYDTGRVIAGTAWAAGTETPFFAQANGGQGALLNTGATFVKNEFDTNMINNSQLPEGYYFVCTSIQCQLSIPESLDTTAIGANNTMNPTSAGTTASGSNTLLAAAQNVSLRFRLDNKDLEQGPLWNYPTDFGVSGFSSATGTVAQASLSGVNNNGLGQGRLLTYFRHLKPLQRFNVFVKNNVAMSAVPTGFNIRIALVGWLWLPVG